VKNEATLVIVIIFKFAHDKEKGKRKKDESFFVTTVQGTGTKQRYVPNCSIRYVRTVWVHTNLPGWVVCTVLYSSFSTC
jgi:hypothetical protein